MPCLNVKTISGYALNEVISIAFVPATEVAPTEVALTGVALACSTKLAKTKRLHKHYIQPLSFISLNLQGGKVGQAAQSIY
mgnify:CR=1 FL=1